MLFEKGFVDLEDKCGKNIRFADVIATKQPWLVALLNKETIF
jgi:hypothetical protein